MQAALDEDFGKNSGSLAGSKEQMMTLLKSDSYKFWLIGLTTLLVILGLAAYRFNSNTLQKDTLTIGISPLMPICYKVSQMI